MGLRSIGKRFALVLVSAFFCLFGLFGGPALGEPDPVASDAEDPLDDSIEVIRVVGRQPQTATSSQTVPASSFEMRPLESGGQMLEAVPNLVTAQHTGGGKAEQYFIRGFDADHGTDLAVYFDGVPVNLRSHAHGQGFIDLHFVTPETIERLDAYKGPYWVRYGDFSTAATVEYVPESAPPESFVRFEAGEWDTFRSVAVLAPRAGPFQAGGPARGFLSFEAYHTDGPFENDEDLWRYSTLARVELDVSPDLTLSGHLLGYHAEWHASGLIPQQLVRDGSLSRFGSLDPSEGGDSTRVQGKLQLDWYPTAEGHLMVNAYVAYYDLKLFSNFTYFLRDATTGDGIVQRDRDRVYGGGRAEYVHHLDTAFPVQLRGGVETRYDDADVLLGYQTERTITEITSDDSVHQLSLEPYVDAEARPLPWLSVQAGLRFAWFHFEGRDRVLDEGRGSSDATRWLPKANVSARPFSADGPVPVDVGGIRDLELYANFGIGYHSNDARSVSRDDVGRSLPRAIGTELGFRTHFFEHLEVAVAGWYLNLQNELVFVGDEGTTEAAGETDRLGVEFAATLRPFDFWYLRGDVAYTSARLADGDTPLAQAPRFVAKAATGVLYEGFAAELGVRHLGERYATEDELGLKLSDYTVLDLAVRYRASFVEVGFAIENLTNTSWRSSEFYYESQPTVSGPAEEDFHFTPGNPRNVRAWITAYY